MFLPRDRGLLYPRTLPALTSIEGVGNEGLHKTTPGSDTYIKPDILFCSAKMFSCKFYVQGLPFDVKSREIHNLATRFDGCVGSYLSHCNGSPVGVLEFANFDAARHAAAALHNYPFDRDNQQYISVHFPDYYPSGTNVLEHNTLGVQRMWGGETTQTANGHPRGYCSGSRETKDTHQTPRHRYQRGKPSPIPSSTCIVITINNDVGQLTLMVIFAGGSAVDLRETRGIQDAEDDPKAAEPARVRGVRLLSGRVRCGGRIQRGIPGPVFEDEGQGGAGQRRQTSLGSIPAGTSCTSSHPAEETGPKELRAGGSFK